MGLDSFYYGLAYRFGKPRWDSDQPRAELDRLIDSRPPGGLWIWAAGPVPATFI